MYKTKCYCDYVFSTFNGYVDIWIFLMNDSQRWMYDFIIIINQCGEIFVKNPNNATHYITFCWGAHLKFSLQNPMDTNWITKESISKGNTKSSFGGIVICFFFFITYNFFILFLQLNLMKMTLCNWTELESFRNVFWVQCRLWPKLFKNHIPKLKLHIRF